MDSGFHDAFCAALEGDDVALDPWCADRAAGAAGLAVYRNTIASGRAETLARRFPAIERLVGPEWFRAAALEYAREHPPAGPVMAEFGDGFAAWLAAFPPARELTWLAPVARLDQAWGEAHAAPDAPVLDAAAVAGVEAGALFRSRARPHPSARLFWFDWPAPTIWRANREVAADPGPLVWAPRGEGLLIVRPRFEVEDHSLERADWAFVDACRAGRPLGDAGLAALRADPETDLSALFARLIAAGVFTRLIQESQT